LKATAGKRSIAQINAKNWRMMKVALYTRKNAYSAVLFLLQRKRIKKLARKNVDANKDTKHRKNTTPAGIAEKFSQKKMPTG
jgi:hypothetical protein